MSYAEFEAGENIKADSPVYYGDDGKVYGPPSKVVRVLFHKAKIGNGHILDDLIAWWTLPWNWGTGHYSHAEIWLPDGDGENGVCYTSTMGSFRDKPLGKQTKVDGVVMRPAAAVIGKHPERWDVCEIKASQPFYNAMVLWMDTIAEQHPRYDRLAILSFLTPWRFHKKEQFICSEFCAAALWWLPIRGLPEVPSPRRLARCLLRKGYTIRPLTEISV